MSHGYGGEGVGSIQDLTLIVLFYGAALLILGFHSLRQHGLPFTAGRRASLATEWLREQEAKQRAEVKRREDFERLLNSPDAQMMFSAMAADAIARLKAEDLRSH
jgi:hypothetical protein